jgi:hypothetical protein
VTLWHLHHHRHTLPQSHPGHPLPVYRIVHLLPYRLRGYAIHFRSGLLHSIRLKALNSWQNCCDGHSRSYNPRIGKRNSNPRGTLFESVPSLVVVLWLSIGWLRARVALSVCVTTGIYDLAIKIYVYNCYTVGLFLICGGERNSH